MEAEIDRLIPIERFGEIDSTSAYARRQVKSGAGGESPRLIVARTQTAGEGRQGRDWVSPVGGIWCTLIWPLQEDSRAIVDGMGIRVGLATMRTVDEFLEGSRCPLRTELRWPNDVMLGLGKLGGILTELLMHEGRWYALVGVGVNTNNIWDDLPEEVRRRATTLSENSVHVRPEDFLASLRRHLREAMTTEGLPRAWLDEAQSRLFRKGCATTVRARDGSTVTGIAIGLDAEGWLLLRNEAGEVFPAI